MTLTLSDFTTRMLEYLGDSSGVRYTSTLLAEALSQALREFSQSSPCIQSATFTVTTPGSSQAILSIPAYQSVLSVFYPFNTSDLDSVQLSSYYATHDGTSLVLTLPGSRIPAAGEKIKINYSCNHTIDGLDGYSSTTVNPTYEAIIAQGAAGLAATMRAAQVVEAPGKRAKDTDNLIKWGKAQHDSYIATLQLLAMVSSGAQAPVSGWSMDEWDTRPLSSLSPASPSSLFISPSPTVTSLGYYNVKDYGAVGDGVADDTLAFSLAIAAAGLGGVTYAPKGAYKLTGLGVAVGQYERLIGSSFGGTLLKVAGTLGIYVTGDGWQIENIGIVPFTGNDYLFDGILVEGTSNRGHMLDVYVSKASKALRVKGLCHESSYDGLFFNLIKDIGISLELDSGLHPPSQNNFRIKKIHGIDTALSVGISARGTTNWFGYGDLDHFSIGVENTGVSADAGMNRFEHIFVENNSTVAGRNYALHAVSGVTYWNCMTQSGTKIVKDAGALVLTPTGGFAPQINVPPPQIDLSKCEGLYLFKEQTGATVADLSGHSRDATIAGGAAWVTPGLSAGAVECDNTSGQYIDIPIAVIDSTAGYTILIAWKPVLCTASGKNNIIRFLSDSGTAEFKIATENGTDYWYKVRGTPAGGVEHTAVIDSAWHVDDQFNILAFYYDPVAGTITPRYPDGVNWAEPVAFANTLTAPLDSIQLNGGTANPHTLQFAMAAFFQCDLTYEEVLAFMNNLPILTHVL